jgi:hypothetical protein
MLKRNFIVVAIIGLAFIFSANAFGQNSKRISSSPRKTKQAKKGVAEWTDILAVKNKAKTKNSRITKRPNQATGGTIPVYWNIKSPNNRQRNLKRKSKAQNLLPYMEQNNLRKTPKRKPNK